MVVQVVWKLFFHGPKHVQSVVAVQVVEESCMDTNMFKVASVGIGWGIGKALR